MFSFFVGFYLFTYQQAYFNKIRKLLGAFLTIVVTIGARLWLDRFSGSVFFPYMFKRAKIFSYVVLLLINIIYAITFESLTVLLITVILSVIVVIKKYYQFQLTAIIAGVSFFILVIFVSPSLKLYKRGEYRLFGNTTAVMEDNVLLRIDPNSTWRLLFWYRVVIENFPQNIVGIGMGTPLLYYMPGHDTTESAFDDEHDIHVMGVHNSFLTLFVRLGVPFLFILLYIYIVIFKDYYSWRHYYQANNFILLFLSFFTISVIGLFNLVLESPIYASLYWILLGFVARAIEFRKLETALF
jgi:hypothetical protein